jgi:hypothetical protein
MFFALTMVSAMAIICHLGHLRILKICCRLNMLRQSETRDGEFLSGMLVDS